MAYIRILLQLFHFYWMRKGNSRAQNKIIVNPNFYVKTHITSARGLVRKIFIRSYGHINIGHNQMAYVWMMMMMLTMVVVITLAW